MEPPSVGGSVSSASFSDKLAPENAEKSLKAATTSYNKVSDTGKNTINKYKNERTKQYYIDTYNGDPSGNLPYPRMDIVEVFRRFVTYTTPDDSHETAKGTAMDLSRVVLGLQPTYKTLPDVSMNESKQKMSTRFVGYLVRATDLATANNVVLHLQDTVQKSSGSVTEGAPVYMSSENITKLKSELEVFRLPLMDAMFAFDNPKLHASAQAPAPSPPPPAEPPNAVNEGFSTRISSDVGWSLLYGLGAVVSVVLIWTLALRKRHLLWCRPCSTRTKTRRNR